MSVVVQYSIKNREKIEKTGFVPKKCSFVKQILKISEKCHCVFRIHELLTIFADLPVYAYIYDEVLFWSSRGGASVIGIYNTAEKKTSDLLRIIAGFMCLGFKSVNAPKPARVSFRQLRLCTT